MIKHSFKSCALGGAALAALAAASSAQAQAADAAADEVVVTGSRIIKDGFAQPTPVTVVTMEQMQATAPNSLSDAINQLPQFKSSFISASTGFRNGAGDGGNFVNLRGLSPKRTLVLLDGKRVVQSQANSSVAGAVDLNVLPQSLVKRVDVVTGGASAAYGADALSGVVHFILDTKFTGLKREVRYGVSTYGDDQTYDVSLAYGHAFAGGRGHVIGSFEHYKTFGIKDFTDRRWADNSSATFTTTTALPQTSTSNPTRIIASNIRASNMTSGGLITAGATALRDFAFTGTNATLTAFPVGAMRNATTMIGGGLDPDYGRYFSSLPPASRNDAFLRASYDLTPDWNLYAEALYGNAQNRYRGTLSSGANTQAFTIFADNVYLPAAARALIGGPGATTTALYNPATGAFNGPVTPIITVNRIDTDWGFKTETSFFSTMRGVLGLDGKIGGWSVNAYYTHGEATHKIGGRGYANVNRLFAAVDAVASPGTAGLPAAGTPMCRSTITNTANGCIPLNVIGQNVANPAALAWIIGSAPTLKQKLKQDVADFTVHGEPFSSWAGPVSVGAGATYRKETVFGTADAISESYNPAIVGTSAYTAGLTPALSINGFPSTLRGARGGWETGNPGGMKGQYSVKEVYAETLIPLLKDSPFARSLDLNGAIRYARYSTSGGVLNWKVGLSYRPIEDLRIRTTRSRDVRAANLADLYGGITAAHPAISDPFRLGTTGSPESNANAITSSRGNPTLSPEFGDTFTLGAVYQPSWLQGFSVSADYYSIIITNAIASAGAATILNQCQQGNKAFCTLVARNIDPTSFGAGNTIGPITVLENSPQNIGTTKNAGFDVEASYRLPLSRFAEDRDDILTLRVLASYTGKNAATVVGTTSVTNSVGIVGGGIVGGTGGNTNWQGSLNINYQNGPLTVNWQTRFINKGRLVATADEAGNPYPANLLVNPNTNGNGQVPNSVPAYFYNDLTLNYKFGRDRRFEGFLTINNLLDKDPPRIGTFFFYGVEPTNYSLYDSIGRNFTAGLRFKF